MSIKHLDKLVICHIDCSIWSGRKKLRPEDFRLPDGTLLPPTEVASLGSKKICDPEALNHFERLKKEAQRQCELVGVKFLGGYAIPENLINSIIPELDRIGQEFMHHKHLFLANYDSVTKGWVEKHPNFAEAIARAISPIQDVQERFQFNYTLYRMKPAKQKTELENKVSGMGMTLFNEIARDANELFRLSVAGKEQLSQRAINPLKRIHNKLNGLSFLDNRVQPVVDTLSGLLNRFPANGAVTGSLFHETVSTILMLTDPEKLKMHAETFLNSTSMVIANHEDKENSLISNSNHPLRTKTNEVNSIKELKRTTHISKSSDAKGNQSNPDASSRTIDNNKAKDDSVKINKMNKKQSHYF